MIDCWPVSCATIWEFWRLVEPQIEAVAIQGGIPFDELFAKLAGQGACTPLFIRVDAPLDRCYNVGIDAEREE